MLCFVFVSSMATQREPLWMRRQEEERGGESQDFKVETVADAF